MLIANNELAFQRKKDRFLDNRKLSRSWRSQSTIKKHEKTKFYQNDLNAEGKYFI